MIPHLVDSQLVMLVLLAQPSIYQNFGKDAAAMIAGLQTDRASRGEASGRPVALWPKRVCPSTTARPRAVIMSPPIAVAPIRRRSLAGGWVVSRGA